MRKLGALSCGTLFLLGLLTVRASPQAPTGVGDSPREPEVLRPLDLDTTAVRLILGVADTEIRPWDGKVKVDKGEVVGVEGWRFRQDDKVVGRNSWRGRSLAVRNAAAVKKAQGVFKAKKAFAAKRKQQDPEAAQFLGGAVTPTGVVVRLKSPEDATLTVETPQGNASIKLADLTAGASRPYLDGKISARLVPTYAPFAVGPHEEDFPAAAPDGNGGAWVAFVSHIPRGPVASEAYKEKPESFKSLIPEGGGDQIELLRHVPSGGIPKVPIHITTPGRDVWRPAVIADIQGKIVVVWSELRSGNWDLFTAAYDPSTATVSEARRLTNDPGTDTDPALALSKGKVLVAWQAWRGGQADILVAPLDDPSQAINVSNHPANEWSPALASGPSGVSVAFDSYRNGNYDVFAARLSERRDERPELIAVANSSKFEARPTLAVDPQGRAWVAYEERDDNWGKDFGKLDGEVQGKGNSLYHSSAVRVRVLDGARVLDAADPVASLSDLQEQRFNSLPRIAVDRSGRPWLLYRHRQEAIFGLNPVMFAGGAWVEYATALVGKSWTPPQPLPRSDNLIDNRPAIVARPEGGLLAYYSADGRLHHQVESSPDLALKYSTHLGTPPWALNNELFVASLAAPLNAAEALLLERPAPSEAVPPAHANEEADVARIRAHRIQAGGKTYRLLRGEFHRHTDISFDGGGDGSLEDLWRYALDAGRLDWIGNGDHDNGGGREYTWWLTQKTTDLYHAPPAFVPMFTYERSVQYPGGHRNVMFPYRGVRILPRLVDEKGVRSDVKGVDEDAQLLYDYLHELGGICAAHTTATNMGTDWRAHDSKVEPIVEIYQGIRDSYEHLGGPRVARSPTEAAGGWKPLGMVWNALALQYRLGFQSSSDHVSTHMSYAVALSEDATRHSIFEAFQKRHCYAATDNIVLDVRSGDHLMGDDFESAGPVSIKVFAHGTAKIKQIDIVKDFLYVYSTEPAKEQVSFTWTDTETRAVPVSWYYVRVLQDDGEIAWGSPIWVRRPGVPAPR